MGPLLSLLSGSEVEDGWRWGEVDGTWLVDWWVVLLLLGKAGEGVDKEMRAWLRFLCGR